MPSPVSRRLVLLLAIASGTAVANLYYAQPLLGDIGHGLHASSGSTGLVITTSQIGYALGLVLLVPLGDLVGRRRLISVLFAICALAQLGCALAPSLGVLAVTAVVVGLTSVAAQVTVPLAGDLAPEADRGKVVGTVMSGLLIGILLARTVSGAIAGVGGWRSVFVIAAVVMALLAVVLWRALPDVPRPAHGSSYLGLLRSVGRLIREHRTLRVRMLYGALQMGVFSLVWTALSFLLSAKPYDFSVATIGLFGLAGLSGAAMAQQAGRLADQGRSHLATGLFWSLVLGGMVLVGLAQVSLVLLVVGLVVLDAGIQGSQITNQTVIYGLDAGARSRLTTAYMTSVFVAAAIGSAAASIGWDAGGWRAITGIGLALPVVALLVWGFEHLRRP